MNRISTALLITLTILSCHHPMDEANNSLRSNVFNTKVGDRIPTDTGRRWIEQYKRQLAGARDGQSYKVTKPNLEAMIQSTTDLIGLTFHHALDNAGEHHVIIIPLDSELRIWTSNSQRVLLDTNTDSAIDITAAREWVENYRTAFPNDIRYHFFGTDIFEEIMLSEEFEIREAINDEEIPQMLIVVQADGTNGRISDSESMYDASLECPRECAKEN